MLPATLQAADRDPSGGFLFPTREGCSGPGPAWPPSRGPAPATEAARPRPPQLLGISGRGVQSWAATRACGVFSGPLLVWAPVQSDKELSVSPSSPAHPPTCLTQDSGPLRGPVSPDTSKAFPPRGWGVPRRSPLSAQGSASKAECNRGAGPPCERPYRFGGGSPQEGPPHHRGEGCPLCRKGLDALPPRPSPNRPGPLLAPLVSSWLQENAGEVEAGRGRAPA